MYDIQENPESQTLLHFQKEYPLGVKPRIKAQILGPNTPQKKKNGLELPESIQKSLELFGSYLDSKLYPTIIPLIRSMIADWSFEENTLLFNGLLNYGQNDIASIRAHYLPTKSMNQLKIKLKNSRYRRALVVDNRIKTYFLQPFKPLLLYERELIIQGLRTHGKKFRYMVKNLFRYTPLAFLKEVWDELYITKEIEYDWLDSKPRAQREHKVKPSKPPPSVSFPTIHPSLYKIPIPRQGSIPWQDSLNYVHMLPYNMNMNLPGSSVLLEDTGSVYQPSSEWDMSHFTDLEPLYEPIHEPLQEQQQLESGQEAPNYDDFLHTIFELKDEEEEDQLEQYLEPEPIEQVIEQQLLVEQVQEEEYRPKISLSGAYDCQSSDQDEQECIEKFEEKMDDFFEFTRGKL